MANPAPSAAPSYAHLCWVDDHHVFIEVPHKDPSQPPLVMKFDRTDAGFAKGLKLLCVAHKKEAPKGGRYPIMAHPATKRPVITDMSQEMREKARKVLKKMGIT